MLTWGKYETTGGKTALFLSMNIHHAAADGFHLSGFFPEVRRRADEFDELSA